MRYYQLAILSLLTLSAYCQTDLSLHLEYNLFTNEIKYLRAGKIIEEPRLKKGENLMVRVIEFNPYTTEASMNVNQVNAHNSNMQATGSDFSGMSSTNFSIGNLLGGLSLGSGLSGAFSSIPGSRGVSSADMMRMRSEYSALLNELEAVENEINESRNKIELFQQVQQSKQLAKADLESLKTNDKIKPSRIRAILEEEILHAFAKTENETITIDDLVNEQKKVEEFKASIQRYNDSKKQYQELQTKWYSLELFIQSLHLNSNDPQLSFIIESTDSIVSQMNQNIANYQQIQDNQIESALQDDHVLMAKLRQTYEELQGNIFEYHFPPIQAQGDAVEIELVFNNLISLSGTNERRFTQTIPVTGSWKISGGVGLCFGGFTGSQQAYGVVNDQIVGNPIDEFIPLVATFAHFYAQTHKPFNIGGSFGVGLPILGGDNVSAASFFLGPTLIIGQQQRLLLSFGAMGAKSQNLSAGFELGDTFEASGGLLPIVEKYQLGYFVGISFNVLN